MFQVYSKVIQLYIPMYLSFLELFFHLGYYRILPRVPCAVQDICFKYSSASGSIVILTVLVLPTQEHVAFQARFFGVSSSHCQTPWLESLMWSSGLLLLWENFYSIFSSLWITHPVDMRFDFIMIILFLPSCCGLLSLDVGIFFFYFL